jgi:hypothetical protein
MKGSVAGLPAMAGRGTEAGLLAGLVAPLHIGTHPQGVTKRCLTFQESLDGAMGVREQWPVIRNS